jgi:hypothetical protein
MRSADDDEVQAEGARRLDGAPKMRCVAQTVRYRCPVPVEDQRLEPPIEMGKRDSCRRRERAHVTTVVGREAAAIVGGYGRARRISTEPVRGPGRMSASLPAGRMKVMFYPPFGLYQLCTQLAEWLRSPPPPLESSDDLRTCRFCRQPFVGPLDCRANGDTRWRIVLRCGNCDRRREVIVTNEHASEFERDVARDIAAIARDLERLDSERLLAQADAFAAALARDLIDASDFS